MESICECMDKLDASLEMQGTPFEQKTENNGEMCIRDSSDRDPAVDCHFPDQ